MAKKGNTDREVIERAIAGIGHDDPAAVVEALQSFLVTEVESGDVLRGLQAMRLILSTTMALVPGTVVPNVAAQLRSVLSDINALSPPVKNNRLTQIQDATVVPLAKRA